MRMKKIRLLFLTLVALLGGVVSSSAKTVYVDPVGASTWMNDNPAISLYVFGDGDGWASSTTLSDGVIKFTFDDKYTSMIIVRSDVANSWDGTYKNQTEDITSIQLNKLYKANGFNNSTLLYTVEDYTEPVAAGYTCDFNTAISTSDHAFQVASNWRHIVGTYTDYWGDESYPSYNYSETAGVDGSGALSCITNQNTNNIYDLLVTPVVKGTVTIAAKATASYYTPQLTFYKITDNGDGTYTRGDQITVDVSAINTSDYTTITIPVDEAGERIGIRSSYVWLDNFTATEATIVPEAKLTIASAVPSATTGTIKWEQQANGKVLVSYTVTVTNTGEVDLTQGDDGFSVSIINGTTGDVYATVAVPQNLAIGETSDEFVVSAEVETSLWPNSYTYISMNLKENIFGSVVTRAQSTYVAYEPILVFRAAESTSTSSITEAQAWGTITESKTENFEIANTGTAPLTIKSITLPEGFTSDNAPTAEFTLAKGETQALNITQDATTTGTFAGNLAIVYLDKDGAEQTYTLAFSATVIGENTWTADFNGSTSSGVTYPVGAIAESGISTDYQYISSGNYNIWLTGRTTSSYATENNKFITPKLHANAGDQLTFDAKAGYSSTNAYYVKVYVSTDRVNWGDPVAYYTYTTDESLGSEGITSAWTTKTITFDQEGDYYVAFALYGTSGIDNLVGLEKVDVAHDLYIKEVSWPDASVKSGTALTKPSVSIIPLTNETADAYTVKYICGETVLAEGTPVALTASASSTTSIAFSWTPEVEETTTYEGTKVVIEFTDGTKFETETFDLTVTNEAIFHFLNSTPSSKWYEPTDRSDAITFGKTNTDDTQSFVIFNWGSADLTVNSISLPEGFTTTTEFPLTVAAFNGENDGLAASSQALDITFSAATAGTFSGDMVITYSGDQTFTLAISGTKLDPTKFYANFDDGGWPAGSVYQSNISSSNQGTYSVPNYAITSSSTTNNIFVTPKLTATAGEKLLFDAKLYSSYWSEGAVKVYAAATRDEVLNAEEGTTRTQLFYASGEDTEANATITTDYQTFEVPALAGDYYYGFEISNRPYVDEIYGLTVAEVAHEWQIASSNIPEEATQNVAFTATVNILNLGLADEAAEDITVTAYLDGEAVATGEAVAIPMNHKLNDAGTQLSVNILSTKTGEFPVYLEVKAGDYSVTTETVNVTFAEEVFVSDAIEIGSGTTTSTSYAPIDFYNFESARTSDILYTKDQLTTFGLKDGDRIITLAFKGTASSAKTISKSSLKAWVALSTGDITYNSPDKTAMTEVTVYNAGEMAFVAGTNMVTINLPEAITYDGTSDLRIYLEGGGNSEYVGLNFAYDTNYSNMKWSNATSMKYNPLLYVTLEATAPVLAGTVKTSAGEGIANATITLKAENGVEYSGTTAADGTYSFDVIQAGLDFTATVEAAGYLKRQFALNMNGASATSDVTMYTQFGLVGTLPGLYESTDVVMQPTEDPNIFTAEIKNVAVTAGDYWYKLRADGAWNLANGYQLPAGSDNFNWTFNTAGTYNFKFTFDWTNHTLTFERPFTLAEDNATEIAALNWVDVTVEREFKAGWNAVVLPFALSAEEVTEAFGENSELAVYDGDTNDNGAVTVKFKKIEGEYKYMSAGYPYMLWLEEAVSGLKFTKNIVAEQSVAKGTTFDFVGVYTTTDANAGDYFVSGGKFVKATNNNTVKPFRSYLKLKDGQSAARSLNFVFDDQTTTELIEGLEIEGQTIVEGVYNLNGQKVQDMNRKGLYIINGKKVMVK